MKKKRIAALVLSAAVFLSSVPVYASGNGYNTPVAAQEISAKDEKIPEAVTGQDVTAGMSSKAQVKPGWVKTKSGRYYWREEDGTRLRKEGLYTLNGKKYYINSYAYRSANCWKQIKGKWYYFQKNGVMYEKTGWFTNKNEKFYLGKGGYRFSGLKKINGKTYYFNKYGRLVRNKKEILINGKYYDIASNGVTKQLSTAKIQCSREARNFINKHTNPSMSNYQKLRACYSYLLAYMHYRPKPFNAAEFQGTDWPYTRALSVFQSSLTGNCYGFACCVAACAKELGYDPYVIITTGDHGFVMINGLYYDNMYATFGSASHFAYNTYLKVKF